MKTPIDSHSGLFLTLSEWEFLDSLANLGYEIEATAYRNDRSFVILDGRVREWWLFDVADDLAKGPPLVVEAAAEESLIEGAIFVEFDRRPRSGHPSPTTVVVLAEATAEDWQQFRFDVRVDRVLSQIKWEEILRVEDLLSGAEIDGENVYSDDDYDLRGREAIYRGSELLISG